MAKTKYNVDDIVYAIDTFKYEHCEFTQDFYRIEKCRITSINIDENGVRYWVENLKTKSEYDESIPESNIAFGEIEICKQLINLCKI